VGGPENELRKLSPEVAPATGYCSSTHSVSDRPETDENLKEQVLRQAADPVL